MAKGFVAQGFEHHGTWRVGAACEFDQKTFDQLKAKGLVTTEAPQPAPKAKGGKAPIDPPPLP